MKKDILLLVLAIPVFLMTGCYNNDFYLKRPVFIEDASNPGLPIYSEWGYNTFGVYVDRIPFISNETILPAKIIVHTDTMHLTFSGIMNNPSASLTFSIKGYSPTKFEDLLTLNGQTFNLKNVNCIVTFNDYNQAHVLQIMDGELVFKRAQKLLVDKELTQTILSGTFSFKALKQDVPVAFTSGRFDVGIGYDNFYNY